MISPMQAARLGIHANICMLKVCPFSRFRQIRALLLVPFGTRSPLLGHMVDSGRGSGKSPAAETEAFADLWGIADVPSIDAGSACSGQGAWSRELIRSSFLRIVGTSVQACKARLATHHLPHQRGFPALNSEMQNPRCPRNRGLVRPGAVNCLRKVNCDTSDRNRAGCRLDL